MVKQMKNDYLETPIPEELDFIVIRVLKESEIGMSKNSNRLKGFKIATVALVASYIN